MNAHQRRVAARRFERTHSLTGLSWDDLRAVVEGNPLPPMSPALALWARFAAPGRYPAPALDPQVWWLSKLDDDHMEPMRFERGARNYYLWRKGRRNAS